MALGQASSLKMFTGINIVRSELSGRVNLRKRMGTSRVSAFTAHLQIRERQGLDQSGA